MALFSYKAYDNSGAKVEGQIEAKDKLAALSDLKKQNLLSSEVKVLADAKQSILNFNNKVTLSDLEFLTSELSLLLESAVRIDRRIDIIKRTKAKPALAKLLNSISANLKKAKSLSESVREHGDIFHRQ